MIQDITEASLLFTSLEKEENVHQVIAIRQHLTKHFCSLLVIHIRVKDSLSLTF